jgi:uncharacterized C2H2 Zn-finger protein
MKRGKMEKKFQIDLKKIDGEGEFPCPTCGEVISPDDYSGTAYSISNIKTKEDGALQEITIKCERCGSILCLNGFDALQGLG